MWTLIIITLSSGDVHHIDGFETDKACFQAASQVSYRVEGATDLEIVTQCVDKSWQEN